MAVSSFTYTQVELEFCKLLKCIQVVGKSTMCEVAKEMYSSGKIKSERGAMNLNSYMRRKNIDVNFGDVKHLLGCNIMKRDFDISFAYKIIKEICIDIYENLSESCKEKMASIIELRNNLCHDYVHNLDEKCINSRVKSLKGTLTDIYVGVAKFLNKGVPKSSRINFHTNVKKMEKTLEDIMAAQVSQHDASHHLEVFTQQVEFKVISTGFQDITDISEKLQLKTIDPCTWADEKGKNRFSLETVFTSPELGDAESRIEMSKLLITVKTETKKLPETIVLQGDAGSGKTSFCRFILHTWRRRLKGMDGLLKFDLVLLVEIRRTSANTIEELLREHLLKKTFKAIEADKVMKMLAELDILFIIDGYDESNKKSSALVRDIFEKFKNKRIILTTRTNAQEEVDKITKRYNVDYLLVDLKGFSTSSRKEYITKVFDGMKENSRGFEMYLEGRGKVLDNHLNLPLTVALLIVLWMDDPKNVNNVTTATSLYHELFTLFQKKLGERLISQNKKKITDDILPILSNLLLILGEKAWSMLKEKVDCHLTDELRQQMSVECKKNKINSEEFLSAFLKCEIDGDGDTKQLEYSFLHKTQTEYLASLFLARCISKGKKLEEVGEEVEDWKQFEQLLLYLTGNMALTNNLKGLESKILDYVMKAKIEPSRYSYWWSIISESLIDHDFSGHGKPIQYKNLVHPKVGEIIARDERFLNSHISWSTGHIHVAAALRLIALIPVEVEILRIEIPENVEPTEIPDFLEAIEEIEVHFDKRRKAIKIELSLWRHYSPVGGESCSDRILQATRPWAELTNFTGSLRDYISNFHKKFPYLKNIRCRALTPDILKSFKSLDTMSVLRITVDFSTDKYSEESLPDLSKMKTLEVTFHGITDVKVDWLLTIFNKLSETHGCDRLHLEKVEMSYESVERLLKELQGRIHSSLLVDRLEEADEERQKYLAKLVKFTINW